MASKLKAIDNTDFDVNKANCAKLRQYLRRHWLPVSESKKELIERVIGSFEIGKQPQKFCISSMETCQQNEREADHGPL
ncbi:hypothetical protein DPMN_169452 [Dreissena polymorpha]|uniref:SAP domain-containing protein n=1 Tax=Dreissena polymorpha TaxID=45954 RepID=A0A9D4DXE5_DREPO|nr:hypothetical protein DPMN_169452 [Dreissena polymorpha]